VPTVEEAMRTKDLISIGIFTFILVLTIMSWREYGARRTEGFEDILDDKIIKKILDANEPKITPRDADAAYQTLLRFIRNDYTTGRKFVTDFGIRFFGDQVPIREDLDVRKLMDNYHSPLQRVD
jgi:hypothetical protein